MENSVFRRRRLPHQDVPGKPVFITACLDGSIPASGYSRIEAFREEINARPQPKKMTPSEWEHYKQKLVFGFIDQLLDKEPAVRHLDDTKQAKIVRDAFLHFAGERYQLFAFAVMPSHHHWLFLPIESWAAEVARLQQGKLQTPREIISQSIQSYTATMCNRVRGETGQYWQHETYDHWARDEAELLRIIDYIETNPVKAGLVKSPEDYEWSSAHMRKRLGIPIGEVIPKSE